MAMNTQPEKGFVNGKFRNVGAAAAEASPAEADHVNAPPVETNDDLDAKTRAELDALAAERGVDISQARTKADVVAALKGA